VHTDQPGESGGEATAPSPFDLFLASIATCAGYYVAAFCRARDIDTTGMTLVQRDERDPTTGLPTRIAIELSLPPAFPEKYRAAAVRAAEGCKVKKTLAAMPTIEVIAAPRAQRTEERPDVSTHHV
jgi:ribosomal protein S12 methylthiotransferase accessory factor